MQEASLGDTGDVANEDTQSAEDQLATVVAESCASPMQYTHKTQQHVCAEMVKQVFEIYPPRKKNPSAERLPSWKSLRRKSWSCRL